MPPPRMTCSAPTRVACRHGRMNGWMDGWMPTPQTGHDARSHPNSSPRSDLNGYHASECEGTAARLPPSDAHSKSRHTSAREARRSTTMRTGGAREGRAHLLGLVEEGLDDGDLGGHLAAAHDGCEGLLGVRHCAVQVVKLLLQKEAGHGGGQELSDSLCGCVCAVSSACTTSPCQPQGTVASHTLKL